MTTQVTTLPELGNTVVILGTIKKKELELVQMDFFNKEKGVTEKEWTIRGSVTVEVDEKEKGRKHNHRIEVFNKKADNKVYKGLETVLNEHKVGDFVRVTAKVDANDYVDKENNMVEGNRLQGVFFSRIDKVEDQIPSAEAKIKLVVENYLPINDAKTGQVKEYKVKAFTVGYNGKIVPLHNLIISPELGQAINGFYPVGMNSMGELSFDVNNYLEVTQEESAPKQMAFGREAKSVTTGGKFINNLEVIGGLPPERQFNAQEMQFVQQQRNLQLEEVKQKHAKKQAQAGQKQQSAPAGIQGGIQGGFGAPPAQPQNQGMAFGNAGSISGTNPFESQTLPSTNELPF